MLLVACFVRLGGFLRKKMYGINQPESNCLGCFLYGEDERYTVRQIGEEEEGLPTKRNWR